MSGHALFAVALCLGWVADGEGATETPRGRYEALQRELDGASKRLEEAMEHATGETERRAASKTYRDQEREIVGRLLEFALAHAGDPAAVDALADVVGRQIHPLTGRALEVLLADYLDSEALAAPLGRASNVVGPESPAAERLLRKAADRSPHHRVRGLARLNLADLLEARAELLREIERHPDRTRPLVTSYGAAWGEILARSDCALLQEVEAVLQELVDAYPDVETSRKVPLGAVAEGRLFRLRNLSIGKVAPDIEGVDVEGARFRLGDYRGKVVLLTFSGNWCGPCRALYPEERRLVERLKGRPFVALSVNTDRDAETLRKSIDSGEITWRCWRDGGTGGPITLRWGVSYFPSLFVIDRDGVIRHTDADLGPDRLAATVEALVERADPASSPEQRR